MIRSNHQSCKARPEIGNLHLNVTTPKRFKTFPLNFSTKTRKTPGLRKKESQIQNKMSQPNSNPPGFFYWAPRVSIGALAVAFLIHLNHPASSFSLFSNPESDAAAAASASLVTARTYCYTSVLTEAGNHNKQADCFSVSPDGKFTKVFNSAEDVLIVGDNDYNEDGGSNAVTEMREGYVIPGIWDGHGHLIQYGEFLHSVDLFGAKSADEVRERVRGYLKDDENNAAKEGREVVGSKENWVRGVGWDQMVLGEMPSAVSILVLIYVGKKKGKGILIANK